MDEDNEPYAFEAFDKDIKYVIEQDEHNVWTLISDDDGEAIISGKHFVNRINYYVTENKWEEFEEIILVKTEIQFIDGHYPDDWIPDYLKGTDADPNRDRRLD